MLRTAQFMSLAACTILMAANTGSGSGGRTPTAGASDPVTTSDETPARTSQPQAGGSQSPDISAAPTPTAPADEVEDARPLAGDWDAKLTQVLADATAELRSIATDNGDQDTTIRLNALADKIDSDVARAQAPTA
jgi:hypothetical protein